MAIMGPVTMDGTPCCKETEASQVGVFREKNALMAHRLHDPDTLTAGATDGSRDRVSIGSGGNTVIGTEES